MSIVEQHALLHKVATFLINVRYAIVSLFALITIGMGFAMLDLKIETGFKKLNAGDACKVVMRL